MQRHNPPTFVRHDPGLLLEMRGPEGVLIEHRALLDNLGMLRQLGAIE